MEHNGNTQQNIETEFEYLCNVHKKLLRYILMILPNATFSANSQFCLTDAQA